MLTGTFNNSPLFGGQGNDVFSNSTSALTNAAVAGDLGNDTLTFNLANLGLSGTSSSGGDVVDAITLTLSGLASQTVFVNGNAGTDTIICTAIGNASLFGGQGVDSITAHGAATKIVGGVCTPIQKIKSAPKAKDETSQSKT